MIPEKMLNKNLVNPAYFSEAENEFLIEKVGEGPVAALRHAPADVNPNAVRPLLQKVADLVELEKFPRS